jgi:hypothetical protein
VLPQPGPHVSLGLVVKGPDAETKEAARASVQDTAKLVGLSLLFCSRCVFDVCK